MKWHCPRDHWSPTIFNDRGSPADFDTFSDWLLDHVCHHQRLRTTIIWVGLLDVDRDGGFLHWRLDFWNSNIRRMLRANGASWFSLVR